jgi:hypothetical protein
MKGGNIVISKPNGSGALLIGGGNQILQDFI